ncbi:MAG: response regulator, partial [Desulfobacterales bacterium]|nr:response regulator [Desulfobacterales bacterium]
EQQKQYLAAIISSGKILLGLINDILDLSKIEAGKLDLHYQIINPRSVFNEIKQIFSQKAREKGIDFYMELDPSLPDGLLLDELRLRQIYLNLVGNAVKFTESGHIRLSLKKHPANDSNLLNLIFSVEDTGIGMPENQKKLIFEAFTQQAGQSSAKYGGTGLGLTITRRLVEMMGGEISVESVPKKGSTFHVILKDVSTGTGEDMPAVSRRTVLKASVIFEKALILVADDIVSNRDLLKGFLESFDFEILEAENGREAVDLTERFHPDIILMDIKMPVMDGYDAARIIRNSLPQIPIIAVTASVLQENEDLIKSAGCDGFLRKPVSKTELLTELIQYLPYSEKIETENMEKEKPSFTASLESLSSETISRLPELADVLKNEMTPVRDKLTKTFIFNEIEDFANQIKEIGASYGLDILTDWGDGLFKQAQSFDVEKLPGTLNYFTELVNKISSLAEKG